MMTAIIHVHIITFINAHCSDIVCKGVNLPGEKIYSVIKLTDTRAIALMASSTRGLNLISPKKARLLKLIIKPSL